MRIWSGLVLGAALLSALVGTGADAMPIAPIAGVSADSAVTLVRDGCGPFGHRSHYGYCKPNGRGPGFDGPRPFYGGGPGYGPRRFYGGGPFERRCFIRDTYYGPRRICR